MTPMIRAKITPLFQSDGSVLIRVEQTVVQDEQPVRVLFAEEFSVTPSRSGCSYLSRASFSDGQTLPGTFWIDEAGKRHFVLSAEPGIIPLAGADADARHL